MRKDFTLYPFEAESVQIDEAVSMRTYIHATGKARDFHEKGVQLLQSLLVQISEYKKAMTEVQHLGRQKTSKADVTSTMRNILREIYGSRRIQSLDTRIEEIETLLSKMVEEDVASAIDDLSVSQRELTRRKATEPKPAAGKPTTALDDDYQQWKQSLPTEGTPEWDRWVAMRAYHIQKQKEAAYKRGDASKGDNLHGKDWWDHKSHWQQASDEIRKYVKSGRKNKQFAWSKHFNDWRAHIGQAINEYYDMKEQQNEDFLRSIMPARPKIGYM